MEWLIQSWGAGAWWTHHQTERCNRHLKHQERGQSIQGLRKWVFKADEKQKLAISPALHIGQ